MVALEFVFESLQKIENDEFDELRIKIYNSYEGFYSPYE